MSATFLNCLKLCRQPRIAKFVRVEVGDVHTHTVFYLECAKLMQIWSPPRILFQIICHMLRKQDVPGIATVHHPLRHVDASASKVSLLI